MASKPGVVTRATGGATAGGSALSGTAAKVTAKAKTEVERLRVLKSGSGLRASSLCARASTLLASLLAHPSHLRSAPVTRRRVVFSFAELICQTFSRVPDAAWVGAPSHPHPPTNPASSVTLLLLGS